MFFDNIPNIPNQFVTQINGFSITIKREDLIHPEVSGNKFRKLKYNIQEAIAQKHSSLITFGGAFSNHLAATAAAGAEANMETHGFVRGEELEFKSRNSTLRFCEEKGMHLHFVSRAEYQKKEESRNVQDLLIKNPKAFIIPEGGTNKLAVRGCQEIITEEDKEYTTVCCAVGTGGTFSGIVNSVPEKEVLGFVVVKDEKLKKTINNLTGINHNWRLLYEHDCGGYGKVPPELIEFINDFHKKHQILLDPLYTGKMLFGIFTLIKNKQWHWGNNILIIHTGGIQGIQGVNDRLSRQGKQIIQC